MDMRKTIQILLIVLLVANNAFGVVRYTVTDLGKLPNYSYTSVAEAINNNGQVVGYSQSWTSTQHAFLYSNGNMSDLGTLGGTSSIAYGVNDMGQVVGAAQDASGVSHAFLWSNGTMTDIGSLPGATYSRATGINKNGQICGICSVNGHIRSFLYDNGTITDLGVLPGPGQTSFANAINNNGQIAGYSYTAIQATDAVLWNGSAMLDLGRMGFYSSQATDINDAGLVVGGLSRTVGGDSDAFVYSNGIMTDIGNLPGGRDSYALGVNNSGQVVGVAVNSHANATCFIYDGTTMWDLDTLLPSGFYIDSVAGINDKGQIITGNNGSTKARLLTPVPEPSTIVLLLIGVIGFLFFQRRQ
jgi:probable HAF family extracellular repeat protein